jgi:hypothetical protein
VPLAGYIGREVDRSTYLLGEGFLSIGSGLFISAGSGIGKSVIATQCAILWSCGLPAFDVTPERPLRILIVQAEDDHNKNTKMVRMVAKMGLSESKKDLFEQNVYTGQIRGRSGEELLEMATEIIKEWHYDVLILNPLHSYMKGSVSKEEDCKQFLRVSLDPFLKKHKCAAIIVHHTPKQKSANEDPNRQWSDEMYAMRGSAELTNWARSIIHVASTPSPEVFKFHAAKGFEESDWRERHKYFAHSGEKGRLMWKPADESDIKTANQPQGRNEDDVYEHIPTHDPIAIAAVVEKCRAAGIKNDKALEKIIDSLVSSGRAHIHNMRSKGRKPIAGVSRRESTEDPEGDVLSLMLESGIPENILIEKAKDEPFLYTESEAKKAIELLQARGKIERKSVILSGGGRKWFVFTFGKTPEDTSAACESNEASEK